jgi:hypothetical protein
MWLVLPFGFYSIVQKPNNKRLTVRARVRADLEALRARYLPQLGPTTTLPSSDYQWRATVSHSAFAKAMAAIVMDLDYSNVKDEVARVQGHARAAVYSEVWSVLFHGLPLLDVQSSPPASSRALGTRGRRRPSRSSRAGVSRRRDPPR